MGSFVGEGERPGRADDLYVFRQGMGTRGGESSPRENKAFVSSSRENSWKTPCRRLLSATKSQRAMAGCTPAAAVKGIGKG